MRHKIWSLVIVIVLVCAPLSAQALSIYDLQPRVESASITAKSVVVLNQLTGEVLYEQGSSDVRVPASLVKLTTVLVVLDTQPDWSKVCTVGAGERVGGVAITKANETKFYTMGSLLRATLIPSANDAATALAHCTGLSKAEFLARMQAKAREQGALNTTYVDFSGMSDQNTTTATDVAKIANAAFSTELIRSATRTQSYRLCATDKSCQYLKNTNQLLADKQLTTIAGKTGTLDGAINFAGSFKDAKGHYFIVVVLGGSSKGSRFTEAKELVQFASQRADWSDQFGG